MRHPLLAAILSIALASVEGSASADPPNTALPGYIIAALTDPARPPEQQLRDSLRKPGEVIAFAGLKPGDRVADFISAGGYFTRIFSRIVGTKGRVYSFTPDEELRNCSVDETAGSLALARDSAYPNIVTLVAPLNDFAVAEPLDMVWTALNYHDLHDPFLGPADIAKVNRNFYAALRPGGVLIVIDHAAVAGSGLRDTNTLHRIDPNAIITEVEAAGFRLDAQSDFLRNPNDTRKLRVFDAAIRGKTDQVIFRFRKPL